MYAKSPVAPQTGAHGDLITDLLILLAFRGSIVAFIAIMLLVEHWNTIKYRRMRHKEMEGSERSTEDAKRLFQVFLITDANSMGWNRISSVTGSSSGRTESVFLGR